MKANYKSHQPKFLSKSTLIMVTAIILLGCAQGALAQTPPWTTAANGNDIYKTNPGNVGIGTTVPSAPLHIFGSVETVKQNLTEPTSYIQFGFYEGATKMGAFGYQGSNSSGFVGGPSAMVFGTLGNANTAFLTNGLERLRITGAGYVGINQTNPQALLDVNGSINVSGNINAKFQDVAEWVPSSEKLPTGTVVVLDSTKSNQVIASTVS